MILISPYSQKLRNGERNPKNFPSWEVVVYKLTSLGYEVIQVGVAGEEPIPGVREVLFNLPLDELKKLITECQAWTSVDNFFPHLCNTVSKPGVVIYSKSDPTIFGYANNTNLLKSRASLVEFPFDIWEKVSYDFTAFVPPDEVVAAIIKRLP